jgi:lipopolysaccharide export system permease protein
VTKQLDRYILLEMVVPFLIGQAAIVMLLTGSVLYNNADVLLVNQVPVQYIVRIVLYFIPFLVNMTMPVAMAVAASLAISRLSASSEITVMRASGISMVRIFRPIFVVGLALSVVDFYFGEYIVPASIDRFQAVLNEIPTHLPNVQPLAGQWITATDQSYTMFVRTMIKHKDYIELRGIELTSSPQAVFNKEADDVMIRAENGRYSEGKWTFYKPSELFWREGAGYVLGPPVKNGWLTYTIPVDPQAFDRGFILQLPMWKMSGSSTHTFAELREYVKRNNAAKIRDVFLELDYYFKLSVPFSCLAMALCCPPLAFRFANRGAFMGTLLSICLVFVYWNTMLLMRILGSPSGASQHALLPPMAAAWGQNIIFILAGLWVLRRSE